MQQVCNDKNIASEVLKEEDIPSVYHACFMAPSMLQYTGGKGSWKALLAELEKGTLVCKDNYGTGGNLVFKVRTQAELEQAASINHQRQWRFVAMKTFKANIVLLY